MFGACVNDMGVKLMRTIGTVRARTEIGMQTLAYNMRCYVFLERTQQTAAA